MSNLNARYRKRAEQVVKKGNWIIRADKNGKSYKGFKWSPQGKWTKAPDWHVRAECNGGLFGQDKDYGGVISAGDRLLFCETKGQHIPVNGCKVKTEQARILLIDEIPKGLKFNGSLNLSGYVLPKGLTLGGVGGILYLSGNKLPEGFTIGDVGGSLYLNFCTLPDGFTIGDVGGWLNLGDCVLPEGFTIGDVGGSLNLSGHTLPEGFTIGDVGGSLYLSGCTLPDGFTIGAVGDWLDLSGCTLPGCKTEYEIRKVIQRGAA